MDYSELIDFQINELVCNLDKYEDYCGDWRCAGQLMEDNDIGLDNNPSRTGSMAFDYKNVDNFSINKNPKRAIAICFLMMKAEVK